MSALAKLIPRERELAPAAPPPRTAGAMKAVLTEERFSDPNWIFERKLDGERCGAIRRSGRVRLLSRTQQRLDQTYPELVDALALDGPDLLIDGEIVAFDHGQTSFSRLQQRIGIHDAERARQSPVAVPVQIAPLYS